MTRGIRNKNPLNIRIGCSWLGEVAVNTDGVFEQFQTMAYGVRAAFVLLRRYIMHYEIRSVSGIIERWAPSSENATAMYIREVCRRTGLKPDDVVDFRDEDVMISLFSAMCWVENGVTIAEDIVRQGYSLVFCGDHERK